jgi:hypothetical protein
MIIAICDLKLNLFSFFICGFQHHQRKTIGLYVYISDIRQIVGYRTPVCIQRFPWRLHITITYNLPHLRQYFMKDIGLWWRYGISRHCDEWKYIIIGRIFESEIILIPPSLKISESNSNGSYRNTDEVWREQKQFVSQSKFYLPREHQRIVLYPEPEARDTIY